MTVEVDVRDLVGRPGSHRTVHLVQPIAGLQTELASVPVDRPVEAELLLESVVEGVLASGPVAGVMAFACARCLKSFEGSFRVEVQEMFAADPPPEEDQYRLQEGVVDVEPLIRDAVVTSMPFAPLCRPDCLGLCARCGGDLNLDECSCPPEMDSRWEALSGIRFDQFDLSETPREE
jgi:uncharacterized protein